jgi:hypothetical protein
MLPLTRHLFSLPSLPSLLPSSPPLLGTATASSTDVQRRTERKMAAKEEEGKGGREEAGEGLEGMCFGSSGIFR